ncbi:hypothetical protein ASA1KI_09260 [Opitutales bacterium ASA1]|nr:hypothetical protein ASA1KI_09260 [Opitutales bacterium ASA1]
MGIGLGPARLRAEQAHARQRDAGTNEVLRVVSHASPIGSLVVPLKRPSLLCVGLFTFRSALRGAHRTGPPEA